MRPTVVFEHPRKGKVEVPLGFSWPAFLLGPLWAIVKRLWLICSVLVLAALPITFIDLYAEAHKSIGLTFVALGLIIAYMVVCGRFGNAWWVWTLKRRGFEQRAINEP
jgi:hypothetical protein